MTALPALLLRRIGIVLLVLAVAAGIELPYVAGPFILGTATLALIYALFALSVNLLAGYGGLISLGQAGIMGSAAYGTAYMATHTGSGHLAQTVVGLGAGLVVTAVFGLMAMRTSAVYFMMVTLAQGMIVYGLANSLAPITGAENGLTGVYRPAWVDQGWKYYYLCLLVLLCCVGAMWVIVRSPFGLALRGLRESESRLRMLGYSTQWHRFYGFMLSGFFASVAGVLFAYNNQFVSPSVAEFAVSAQAVLMIILGGIGTLSGPIIGSVVIVFIQNVLSVHVDRWPTVMGAIFIVMVLFARNGFVGGVSRLWHATAARGAGRPSKAEPGTALDPSRPADPVPDVPEGRMAP